jgi:thiamine transport system permease protein
LIYHHLSTAGADNHDRAMVLTVVLMSLALLVFVMLDATEKNHSDKAT